MSRWFRHYAGMMRDEKLVRAALRAKQPIERVVWIWGAILESAAEINDEGRYDLDIPEVSYFLRADEADISSIVANLEALGRLDGSRVAKWGDRQFQSDRSGGTARGKESYVYFIGQTWGSTVKIGYSKNPWARVVEFQTGHSEKLAVLAAFRCQANSEIDLHALFKKFRKSGEWFDLPVCIYTVIQRAIEAKIDYESLVVQLRSLRRSTTLETETELDTEKKEDIRAVAKATRPKVDETFEEFWKAYPRRDGANPKSPALKVFRSLITAGVGPQAIIDGARRCAEKEHAKVGTAYIPQAIKWLRDRRWEDYLADAAEAQRCAVKAAETGFYAVDGSPELDAWDAYSRATKGIGAMRDRNFGWWFSTRWPPGYVVEETHRESAGEGV